VLANGPVSALVMIDGDSDYAFSTGWSHGPEARLRAAGRDVVWFRYDGKDYVIHDSRTLGTLHEFMKRQTESTHGQRDLARQQAELAREQRRLASDQARLAREQSHAAVEGQRGGEAERDASDARIESLRRQQDELRAQQDALRAQQDELAQQQDALREAQESANDQVATEFTRLLERAIADGTAQLER
jgi:chromosome segregation ATPase